MIDLSSGEDDAIVQVSSESTNEEEESEPGGAHANDALNLPDSQGRVLVNLSHPPSETDIFLTPQLARAVKPHQVLLLLHTKYQHFIKIPKTSKMLFSLSCVKICLWFEICTVH